MSSTMDYVKREAEEITGRTGRYIPLYRMANLTKAAQKITDQLVKADLAMTYEECMIVLDVVRGTIRAVTGEER
ncbi:MAG: hypothetical protein IJW45_04770 [Oscillospiraceae bacterium]|nr:hypothetical protein [Oscillospiraceae bacterium]